MSGAVLLLRSFKDEFFPEAPNPNHAVFKLAAFCWCVFLLVLVVPSLFEYLSLNPRMFFPWQLFSAAFVYLSPHTLFFGTLTFWMFGRHIEKELGEKHFFRYFWLCTVSANLFWLLFTWTFRGTEADYAYGLDGAMYAMIYAYSFFFPDRYVSMYGLFRLRSRYCAALFSLLALLNTLLRPYGGKDDLLAIFGMFVGAAYLDVTYNGPLTRKLRELFKEQD